MIDHVIDSLEIASFSSNDIILARALQRGFGLLLQIFEVTNNKICLQMQVFRKL